eukprot:jgi/Mesvir1/9705/Mv12179-RA.4
MDGRPSHGNAAAFGIQETSAPDAASYVDTIPLLRELSQRRRKDGFLLGDEIAARIPTTASMFDFLYPVKAKGRPSPSPDTTGAAAADGDRPVIISVDGRRPLTHRRLAKFLQDEVRLADFGIRRGTRVAILIPNGPELPVTLMACCAYATSVPINPANTIEEIEGEIRNVRATVMLMAEGQGEQFLSLAERLGPQMSIVELLPSRTRAGLFTLRSRLTGDAGSDHSSSGHRTPAHASLVSHQFSGSFNPGSGSHDTGHKHVYDADGHVTEVEMNNQEDVALVLHTSGSTGNKKVVPILLGDMLVGALCIAAATELQPDDVCCNTMPLYHIGGVARNILSPVISRGAVVCMPQFDADEFWQVAALHGCTWYYAGPTMHMLIMDAMERADPGDQQKVRAQLRLVANAAGALLPPVAVRMRQTFPNANVLPSYGSTECMPATSPPRDYLLDRPGTSGQPVGPHLEIQNDYGEKMPVGQAGHIMVRGRPVMRGYENSPEANASSFRRGWFCTGDLGYMDADGFLFITGRSKEVINRGGEIISPYEIEEALMSHARVKDAVAFSVPHDVLQEAIGVAVVTPPGLPRLGLRGLLDHAQSHLHPSKWPFMVVHIPALPKGSTGKIQRVGLAGRFGLKEMTDATPHSARMFEVINAVPFAGPIPTQLITIDPVVVTQKLQAALHQGGPGASGTGNGATSAGELANVDVVVGLDPRHKLVAFVAVGSEDVDAAASIIPNVTAAAEAKLDEFLLPALYVPVASIPRRSDVAPGADASSHAAVLWPKLWDMRAAFECGAGAATEGLLSGGALEAPFDDVEAKLAKLWTNLLASGATDEEVRLARGTDFFAAGGSSLLAGRLSTAMRKAFPGVKLSGTTIFSYRTLGQMAGFVKESLELAAVAESFGPGGATRPTPLNSRAVTPSSSALNLVALAEGSSGSDKEAGPSRGEERGLGRRAPRTSASSRRTSVNSEDSSGGYTTDGGDEDENDVWAWGGRSGGSGRGEPPGGELVPKDGNHDRFTPIACKNQFAPHVLLIQLLPLVLFQPLVHIPKWSGFLNIWIELQGPNVGIERFWSLVLAIIFMAIAGDLLRPFLGILLKWLLIGRFKPGRYPLWGSYYLRWWLVSQSVRFFGKGVFKSSRWSMALYWRLLGATVGQGVVISPHANLGEADLLTLGDGVVLDARAYVRPFCVDHGCMHLSAITMGPGSGACARGVVAPGTHVPAGAVLGPNSSSHELKGWKNVGENRIFCRAAMDTPPAASWRGASAPAATSGTRGLSKAQGLEAHPAWTSDASESGLSAYEDLHAPPANGSKRLVASPSRVVLQASGDISGRQDDAMEAGMRGMSPNSSGGDGAAVAKNSARDSAKGSARDSAKGGAHKSRLNVVEKASGGEGGAPPPAPTVRYLWLLKLVLGYPVLAAVTVAERIPWLVIIFFVVSTDGPDLTTWRLAFDWFISPRRIFLYLLMRVLRRTAQPLVHLVASIIVKRALFIKFAPGPRNASHWQEFGRWLMGTLLPGGRLGGILGLVGSHYEVVSFVMRLLGAKVGKRVFWPGSGVDLVELDLLEVGDDVVWGSRCIVMACDAIEALPVRIEAGANVADRCVILPGVSVGRNAVLGTGTLGPKNFTFPPNSVYVGSYHGRPIELKAGDPLPTKSGRVLQDYDEATAEAEPTIKAFGRAVYGEGPKGYTMWIPWWGWPFLLTSWRGLIGMFKASPMVISWVITDAILGVTDGVRYGRQIDHSDVGFGAFFGVLLGIYTALHAAFMVLSLAVDVGSKWALIGRRKEGDYSWDSSSYCLRWNVYLSVIAIRRRILNYLEGSAWLVLYFRALGCKIGKDVCLYPTGASPMMTEPELVTIEDGAAIDYASVICHTNSKGSFSLTRLLIGKGATLRAHSRLMAGSVLGEGSALLEHTLAMVGDNVEPGDTWQGWPVQDVLEGQAGTPHIFMTKRQAQRKLRRRERRMRRKAWKQSGISLLSTAAVHSSTRSPGEGSLGQLSKSGRKGSQKKIIPMPTIDSVPMPYMTAGLPPIISGDLQNLADELWKEGSSSHRSRRRSQDPNRGRLANEDNAVKEDSDD